MDTRPSHCFCSINLLFDWRIQGQSGSFIHIAIERKDRMMLPDSFPITRCIVPGEL